MAAARETLARQETYGRMVSLAPSGKWHVDVGGCDLVWIEDDEGKIVRFDLRKNVGVQRDLR